MNLCARITVLSQGTTLLSGTPQEVRSDPAVLDAYLGADEAPASRGLSVGSVRTEPAAAPGR